MFCAIYTRRKWKEIEPFAFETVRFAVRWDAVLPLRTRCACVCMLGWAIAATISSHPTRHRRRSHLMCNHVAGRHELTQVRIVQNGGNKTFNCRPVNSPPTDDPELADDCRVRGNAPAGRRREHGTFAHPPSGFADGARYIYPHPYVAGCTTHTHTPAPVVATSSGTPGVG